MAGMTWKRYRDRRSLGSSKGDLRGIDEARVTAWFEAHVEGARPAVVRAIAGGHSNLTFGVTDADGRHFVLRRPPLGHVLATAHDAPQAPDHLRRWRPPTCRSRLLGLCTDESVNGALFYVMAFVDGFVLRDQKTAESFLDEDARRRAANRRSRRARRHPRRRRRRRRSRRLGKHEGYVARQLPSVVLPVPGVERVDQTPRAAGPRAYGFVLADPRAAGVAIVHGDYRLDNTMAWTGAWSPCSTGRSARSATCSPTSACCRCTDRRDRLRGDAARRADAGRRLPGPGPSPPPATRRPPTATCPSSTSTSPSATSGAAVPRRALRQGAMGDAGPGSRPSSRRSPDWLSEPPPSPARFD